MKIAAVGRNPIKKLALVFLFPVLSFAQTDTIFKKDKNKIICTITFVNNDNIFFTEKKDPGKLMDVRKVSFYSLNGKRIDPSQSKILFPQVLDTISVALELDYMKYCFRSFSKQYNSGVITLLAGFAVSGAGITISGTDKNAGMAVVGIGSIVSLVGGIIMIDSHKWIRRAGFGINGKGNSVSIYYTFN